MALDFSPETIRKRFHDLTREHDAIDARLTPLRAELDNLVSGKTKLTVAKAKAREAEVREQIKTLQSELYPIEQERALCSRALGGKTAEPAAAE